MPQVSVVIPAYNPGRFLRMAIESVCAQEFTDWEAVIVDDGSTEDLSWVDEFDQRVRRIRKRNGGLAAARNSGIIESSSPIIALLDADDYWRPTFLKKVVTALQEEHSVGLCHTSYEVVDANGNYLRAGYSRNVTGYLDLLTRNGISSSAVAIRRHVFETVGYFNTSLGAAEDWDMWLRIARQFPLRFLDSIEGGYRRHGNNMSSKKRLMALNIQKVLRAHIRAARRANDTEAVAVARTTLREARLGWGCYAFDDFRVHVRQRRPLAAARELSFALRLAPSYTVGTVMRRLMGRDRAARRAQLRAQQPQPLASLGQE